MTRQDASRLTAMLERLRDDAVMSKFATQRDCEIYRSAVGDMLNMVRGEGWTMETPAPEVKEYAEIGYLLKNQYGFVSAGVPNLADIKIGQTAIYKRIEPQNTHTTKEKS